MTLKNLYLIANVDNDLVCLLMIMKIIRRCWLTVGSWIMLVIQIKLLVDLSMFALKCEHVRFLQDFIVWRALDTMELPSQIRNQAVRFTGQSVQGQMPSISATKKLIQRARLRMKHPCQHLQISHLSLYQTSTNSTILHPTSTNYSYSEIVDKPIPITWWFLDGTTIATGSNIWFS